MIRPACLLALSFVLSACGTIYTDTFSPRLTYYEKQQKIEPAATDLLPPVGTAVPGPGPASMPPVQTTAPGMVTPPNIPAQ